MKLLEYRLDAALFTRIESIHNELDDLALDRQMRHDIEVVIDPQIDSVGQ